MISKKHRQNGENRPKSVTLRRLWCLKTELCLGLGYNLFWILATKRKTAVF